jgi:ATP-dependent RNA helicase DeaD
LYTEEEKKRVRDMLRYTRNTAQPIAFDEQRNIVPVQL